MSPHKARQTDPVAYPDGRPQLTRGIVPVSQGSRRMAARRAAGDDALLAEFDLLEDDGDKISLSALMKQAVTAVLVACLGLFVVGAVSAASAPYSTDVTTDGSAVSGSSDVTAPLPAPPQTRPTPQAPTEPTRRAPTPTSVAVPYGPNSPTRSPLSRTRLAA